MKLLSYMLTAFSLASLATDFRPLTDAEIAQKKSLRIVDALKNPEVAVKQFQVGIPDPAKNLNGNDGNSFGALTTYHSFVTDKCLQWINTVTCQLWMPGFIAGHGIKNNNLENVDDASGLESAMGQHFVKEQSTLDPQTGKVSIFTVKARNGKADEILDLRSQAKRNTLNRENLSDWRLNDSARESAESVGTQSADKAIRDLASEEAKNNPRVMAELDSLRVLAASATQSLYNRFKDVLVSSRVSKPGIEYDIGYGEDCSRYAQSGVQKENTAMTPGSVELSNKSSETQMAEKMGVRQKLCEDMKRQSASIVNPTVQIGNGTPSITAGDKNKERYDEMAARINMKLIEQAGTDPNSNSVTKPDAVNFAREDYSNWITDYAPGGGAFERKLMTNAEQLEEYNNQLDTAEEGRQKVLQRAPDFERVLQSPTKYKLEVGKYDLVTINGPTTAQKQDYSQTSVGANPLFKMGPDRAGELLGLPQADLTVVPTGP